MCVAASADPFGQGGRGVVGDNAQRQFQRRKAAPRVIAGFLQRLVEATLQLNGAEQRGDATTIAAFVVLPRVVLAVALGMFRRVLGVLRLDLVENRLDDLPAAFVQEKLKIFLEVESGSRSGRSREKAGRECGDPLLEIQAGLGRTSDDDLQLLNNEGSQGEGENARLSHGGCLSWEGGRDRVVPMDTPFFFVKSTSLFQTLAIDLSTGWRKQGLLFPWFRPNGATTPDWIQSIAWTQPGWRGSGIPRTGESRDLLFSAYLLALGWLGGPSDVWPTFDQPASRVARALGKLTGDLSLEGLAELLFNDPAGRLKPDAMSFTDSNRRFYELKPDSLAGYQDGIDRMKTYSAGLGPFGFQPGNQFLLAPAGRGLPIGMVQATDGNWYIIFIHGATGRDPTQKGLIYYDTVPLEDGDEVPDEVDEPIQRPWYYNWHLNAERPNYRLFNSDQQVQYQDYDQLPNGGGGGSWRWWVGAGVGVTGLGLAGGFYWAYSAINVESTEIEADAAIDAMIDSNLAA